MANSLVFLCLLAISVSILICVRFAQIMQAVQWKSPQPVRPSSTLCLSVIIPARNEEVDLEKCLRSVLQQQGVEMQVIVVNDHSTDRTAEIANAIANADSRMMVLHDPELRAGWLGKVNAMQCAYEVARHDLILFTDADVIHGPDCFALTLAAMEQQRLDFMSYFPRIRCESLIENVNVPAYFGGFCQITGDCLRPDSPRAFGAGALMLVRRAALDASGGLAGVKAEMLDDVCLATQVKRAGFAVGFTVGVDFLEVRLFKGNRQAFWGMTKNILAEIMQRFWVGPFAALVPVLVFGAPWMAMIVGIASSNWVLLAIGVATYVTQYVLLLPSRKILTFHRGKLLFFPLVSVVILCCYLRAAYHHYVYGAVYWRGRSIRVRTAAP